VSKTVSARIPKNLHEELRERCNNIGCSINDFIAESVKFMLHNESDFDFNGENDEDEEPIEIEKELKPTIEVIEEPTKLTCENGELWTLWNSDKARSKFGDCKNFDMSDGKVYSKRTGELIGIIEKEPKEKIVEI